MKMYEGVETQLHEFLTLELEGGEWSALPPCCVLDRRLGGPQSLSGRGGEEKNLCPCQEPNTPVVPPLYLDPVLTELLRIAMNYGYLK